MAITSAAPAAPAAPGRRERKKLATREALQSAALRLVAARGLDHVTVEDIANTAGVSPRTFFNYFGAKEDAVIGSDPQSWTRLADGLTDGLARRPRDETPVLALRSIAVSLAAGTVADFEDVRLQMQVIEANPALLTRLVTTFVDAEQRLTDVIAERTGTDALQDTYPRLVAATAMAALRTALQTWRHGDFSVPLHVLVHEAFTTLALGLPEPDRDRHP